MVSKRAIARKIERLIDNNDWQNAREMILKELKEDPEDHFYLTRLSLTYYEQRNYRRALRWNQKALAATPRCPLVLWDYAGTLDMLGNGDAALKVYRRLIRRGIVSVAFGTCGEGLRKARGLISDCYYRVARIHEDSGEKRKALNAFEKCLSSRGSSALSIYPAQDVRKRMRSLR